MSRNYDEEFRDNTNRKYQYEIDIFVRERFLERLRPFFSQKNRVEVLEIGSFDGSMTNLLLGYFKQLEVVEPSSELARFVSDRFRDRVYIHNSKVEDFKTEKKYDHIFLVHTLEHLDEPADALIKLRDLLTEQGKLYIMVPNAGALSRRIAMQMGLMSSTTDVLESERIHGHLRTYDISSLRRDILNAKLKILDSGGILVKPLANYQIDAALKTSIIDEKFLLACDGLAEALPDFCSSIYVVAAK